MATINKFKQGDRVEIYNKSTDEKDLYTILSVSDTDYELLYEKGNCLISHSIWWTDNNALLYKDK